MQTLADLGLLEDVTAMLTNIGMQDVLKMDYLAYPDELAEMMGTFELEFEHKYPIPPIEELGKIKFEVKGKKYELSIKNLCLAYGFKPIYGGRIRYIKQSDEKAWKWLSHERYNGGAVKSASIRNPSVRYVHRIIAHTMFARKEADKVKEDEFALLMNGLYPLFRTSFEEEGILSYDGLNLGVLLAKRLVYLKNDWVLKQPPRAKVFIGGFLTPILRACKVPLGNPSNETRSYLDHDSLKRQKFLDMKMLSSWRYKFIPGYQREAWVDLPNRTLTSLLGVENACENLRFMHDNEEQVQQEEPPHQQRTPSTSHDLPLGSTRYHHAPYTGKVHSESVRYALDGVETSSRHAKWLSKSLHHVTKEFKRKLTGMEKQIEDLTALVGAFVLERRSIPTNDDGSTNLEAAMEEARGYYTSHRTQGAHAGEGTSSRPSTYEKRRHIPTPSPPSSDNELIHFSDSDSEE